MPRYRRAILFDLIGTTIRERDPETINRCFGEALTAQGITPDQNFIRQHRGKNKREVITLLAKDYQLDSVHQNKLYNTFLARVADSLHNFESNEGAVEIMSDLHVAEWFVGVGTGLPRVILEKIVTHVQWDRSKIHYLGVAEELGAGRPDPAMLHQVMKFSGIGNPQWVVKVGDTRVDIEEGKNAGVVTVALDANTQPRRLLEEMKPDRLIQSLRELHDILIRDET
jgi:phosphoglycolate phosphatase-like HAD superfamily hydrolase